MNLSAVRSQETIRRFDTTFLPLLARWILSRARDFAARKSMPRILGTFLLSPEARHRGNDNNAMRQEFRNVMTLRAK